MWKMSKYHSNKALESLDISNEPEIEGKQQMKGA
jgi:hypothetical protein